MYLKSEPLYIRFFGLSEDRLERTLASLLNIDDVYFVRIDNYELVLELVQTQSSLKSACDLITERLKPFWVGYGEHNSIERVIGRRLIADHLTITGAESLTAGMFQSMLGNVPGISAVFPGGFVTYSNLAKHRLLSIPSSVIKKYGVVSKPVAKWMASQSRKIMNTDLSVSFTGAAGPSSLEGQPAGTVWIGLSANDSTEARLFHLMPLYRSLAAFQSLKSVNQKSRDAIRILSVKTGLKMLSNWLNAQV